MVFSQKLIHTFCSMYELYLVHVRLGIFGKLCVVAKYVLKRPSSASRGTQNTACSSSVYLIYEGLVTRHNDWLVLQICCSAVGITAH